MSPDQSKIAFAGRYISDPSVIRITWRPLNIFVVDVATREITQITHDVGLGSDRLVGCLVPEGPRYSPDGYDIVFSGNVLNEDLSSDNEIL